MASVEIVTEVGFLGFTPLMTLVDGRHLSDFVEEDGRRRVRGA